MINYTLQCEKKHRFDSWFKSAEAFDMLIEKSLVVCAECGSTNISKAIMAPSVSTARKKESKSQEVAKKYEAVCTPDFFGYNKNLELQYRGRIRELKNLKPVRDGDSDLKTAMKIIAKTQKGPVEQIPSMGCNIKWFN